MVQAHRHIFVITCTVYGVPEGSESSGRNLQVCVDEDEELVVDGKRGTAGDQLPVSNVEGTSRLTQTNDPLLHEEGSIMCKQNYYVKVLCTGPRFSGCKIIHDSYTNGGLHIHSCL